MKIKELNDLLKKEDFNLKEQFKLKRKKKTKIQDKLNNKEKTMNESYKVYNTVGGECIAQGDFNSWQEVETYLNKEWGEYTNQMCKENPSFNATEDEKLNFFASYEIMPIEIEASNLGDNETECPICGCIDCICDGTTCEVDLGAEIEPEGEIIVTEIEPPAEVITMVEPEATEEIAKEEPQEIEGELDGESNTEEEKVEDETQETIEEHINEEEEPKYIVNAFDEHGEVDQLTFQDVISAVNEYQKIDGKAYKELVDCTQPQDTILASEGELPQKVVQEAFSDQMGMMADIAKTDFPKALATTVSTKEDGEILDIADLAKQLADITATLDKQIEELKTDIKLSLQDVKQELKQEVKQEVAQVSDTISDVSKDINSIPDAIDNAISGEEDLEDIEYVDGTEEIEEPEEETEAEETETEKEETESETVEESLSESTEANQGAFVLLQDGTNAEVTEILVNEDGSLKGYKVKINNTDEKEVKPEDVKDILDEHVTEDEKTFDFSEFIKRGVMEDLQDLKNKVDDLVRNNSSTESIKNNIAMRANTEQEKEEATEYAIDAMNKKSEQNEDLQIAAITESLMQSKYNSKLGQLGINLNQTTGVTLNP